MEKTYDIFSCRLQQMYETDKIRTYNSYAHNLIYLYAMYAYYHGYVINQRTSFSPISSLSPVFINNIKKIRNRKKFYCFYSAVKTDEQRALYNDLKQAILG